MLFIGWSEIICGLSFLSGQSDICVGQLWIDRDWFVALSFRLIRDKFGSFFLGKKDGRPDNLRHVNIKNRVTPETKTRIDILKLLASRYRASNPEGRAQVISFEPRPLIKLTPPPTASDRRVKVYNYVEAVRKLPCNFSSDEITPILRRINPELAGQVVLLFTFTL